MKNYYNDTYIPQITKAGKWTCWIGAFLVFFPALAVTYLFNIVPEKGPLMVALVAQLSVNAVWWFIEPISFFPILGIPGTYISFLSGNISNLRIPCAAAALKATNTEVGSEEGSVISTIGVGASVFVNIILLVVGVIVGTKLIAMLPKNVTDSFSFLLPALFGAVFAQFSLDDVKSGVCGMGLGILCLTLYNKGLFNWLPLDPYIINILVPIFGTMLFAKLTYKDNSVDASE
ncbi:hypothetical protein SDC9_101018 [bioreactor metagenome]|jgi:hypothetical protein|uniref:Uncharacterized protein n=1 Tax=bioreactor metagenome TaxID=1076179 RepID=A0A645ATM8_9ZZZZ|nr:MULTISPECIES: hypothetical protein [unclassified Aminobacterium]MEA4878466.1 hypothetical protein [Aminobacterium sp.]WMI71011.1 hypothetical protein RBH88_09100 [Aminobacterium sp. MB27-C1]